MKILLVDDSRAMRQFVRRTLGQIGLGDIEFEEAADGKQALELAIKFRPELVISDINMPGMDGMSMLRKLREHGNDVKVGFVSSTGSSSDVRNNARREGAAFVLPKPFSAEDLWEALSGQQEVQFRALLMAVRGAATGLLGLEPSNAARLVCQIPSRLTGAKVEFAGPNGRQEIGIFASHEGATAIARAMLGPDDDADPSAEDLRDCMCELVNVIGGNLTARPSDRGAHVGSPRAVASDGADPGATELAYELRVGEIPLLCTLTSARPG